MASGNSDRSEEEGLDVSRNNLFAKCVMKTITHPLDYARFLVQVGHEPMAPYPYRTIFGEERLVLPNLFIYAKYIYSVDGFKGMYIGLAPKILGICVEHFTAIAMSDYVKSDKYQNENSKESDLELWKNCALTTSKEMICTATSIILSHPLHVVSMRMMAQFVGYEHRYTHVIQSLLLINKEEGINGLYSGIIPRLLAGLGTVILINVAKQAFSRYVFEPSPLTLHVSEFVASYVANAVTYPLNVVTACSAVNNCGLAAGMPPDMPVFGNWLDCLKYLYKLDHLNRGSSTWFRRVPHVYSKLLKAI